MLLGPSITGLGKQSTTTTAHHAS